MGIISLIQFHNSLQKGLGMETLLDLFAATFIKALLPFAHLFQGKDSNWKCETSMVDTSGIFCVSMAISNKKTWNFQIFCPEEWVKWLWMKTSAMYNTPRTVFENASATTDSQLGRMQSFNADRPLPPFIDLSPLGINVVVTSVIYPEEKELEKVKELLLLELEKKL